MAGYGVRSAFFMHSPCPAGGVQIQPLSKKQITHITFTVTIPRKSLQIRISLVMNCRTCIKDLQVINLTDGAPRAHGSLSLPQQV
jgi:hypothetical protein